MRNVHVHLQLLQICHRFPHVTWNFSREGIVAQVSGAQKQTQMVENLRNQISTKALPWR